MTSGIMENVHKRPTFDRPKTTGIGQYYTSKNGVNCERQLYKCDPYNSMRKQMFWKIFIICSKSLTCTRAVCKVRGLVAERRCYTEGGVTVMPSCSCEGNVVAA